MSPEQGVSVVKQLVERSFDHNTLLSLMFEEGFVRIGSGSMADVMAYGTDKSKRQFAVRVCTDYETDEDGYHYFQEVIAKRPSMKHVTQTYWHYHCSELGFVVTVMPLYEELEMSNLMVFYAADSAVSECGSNSRQHCTLETMIPRLKWRFARHLRIELRRNNERRSELHNIGIKDDATPSFRELLEKHKLFVLELFMLYQQTDYAPGIVGFDLHSGNVMTDPRDGRLVITDPYC